MILILEILKITLFKEQAGGKYPALHRGLNAAMLPRQRGGSQTRPTAGAYIKSSGCNPWKEGLCSHGGDRKRFGSFHCYSLSLSLLLDDPLWGPEKPDAMNRPHWEPKWVGSKACPLGLVGGCQGRQHQAPAHPGQRQKVSSWQ